MKNLVGFIGIATLLMGSTALQAQFFATDVVVQGSICTGLDCLNPETFGFDTLRLKENNLRMHFDDTSNSASFPANDWRIIINDSSNGGDNYFAIEDSTAARIPFRIESGAIANALYVDSNGDVGIGTSTPVVNLHAVDGNTPTLRLEQNGSSGFTPQTWDLAGNETNFFIRDATGGSALPFRIYPGAPTNALTIEGRTGDIGMGTTSPTANVHVVETSPGINTLFKLSNQGEVKFALEDTSTGGVWAMTNAVSGFRISKQGSGFVEMEVDEDGNSTFTGSEPKMTLKNTTTATDWGVANSASGFRVSRQGSGVVEMELFNNGNLTIQGALTQNSDINVKTSITEVDNKQVLDFIVAMPIHKWEYKDARGEAHIGPMAQDFYAAFGLGGTELGISTIDTAGVALVAIKALSAENHSLRQRLKDQEDRLRVLEDQQVKMQTVMTSLLETIQVAPVLTKTAMK